MLYGCFLPRVYLSCRDIGHRREDSDDHNLDLPTNSLHGYSTNSKPRTDYDFRRWTIPLRCAIILLDIITSIFTGSLDENDHTISSDTEVNKRLLPKLIAKILMELY